MRYSFLFLLFLSSCIGTDYVDDPIVGERLEVSQTQLALMKGQSQSLSATFYNQYGIATNAVVSWTSSNSLIASVDAMGVVQGLIAGQAMIIASVGETKSASINVNVVIDESQVASVEIISPENKQSLAVGESHPLQVVVKNINGIAITGKTVQWFTENSAIATVNNTGLVTGISAGVVDVHAKADGVKSNIINFSIGGGKSGTFVSAGGYKAIGMATMKNMDGKLILEFSSNFETSFALGTYVYLANSTNGSQVRAGGLEVAQITTNGAKTFNLSAVKPGITLNDYSYVIILCKPASVTFGYALLK